MPSAMARLASTSVASFAPLCPLFNQIGAPAMSVPLHWTDPTDTAPQGLPIGMMLIGRHWDEAMIYRAAHAYEQAVTIPERGRKRAR